MRKLALALVLVAVAATAVRAADIPEKWVYTSTNLAWEEGVQKMLALIEQGKAAGVTHIQLNEYHTGHMGLMPPRYFANCEKVRRAAEDAGIVIAPCVFAIGSSGRYLLTNPNLADGIPVKDMRFIVQDGKADVDQALSVGVQDAGFDAAQGDSAGWTLVQPEANGSISFDTAVKHSGAASLKLANGPQAPAEPGAPRRRGKPYGAVTTVKVKPFHAYRLSVWIKTDGVRPERHPVQILGSSDKRSLCLAYFMRDTTANWLASDVYRPGDEYPEFGIKPTNDWQQYKVAFNSLNYDEIDIFASFSSSNTGTVWYDDIAIEPAGLLNILRREYTPLIVTSADGTTTYVEGIDFTRVEDPMLGKAPTRGDFMLSSLGTFDIWHNPPSIVLTENSRIKDGDAILASFYSPGIIYVKQQVTVSVSDPAVFDVMDDEMKWVSRVWKSPCYFMSYDEIRSGGWEPQPGGTNYTLGELLGRHVTKAVEIARKYVPDAKLYVWSDAFDPNHNARKLDPGEYYYLVNGSWHGSWEGLPSDVIICNWAGMAMKESLSWFAGRGHQQIIAGYYDVTTNEAVHAGIDKWLTAAQGIPGIIGYEYTCWTGNYDFVPEFFRYLAAWPEDAGKAQGEGPGAPEL